MNSFFIIRCTILQRAGSYNSEVGDDNHLSKTDNLVCSNKYQNNWHSLDGILQIINLWFSYKCILNTWINKGQNFLQCCFKRQYIYYPINIPVYDFLEEADHALFKKISSMPGHPLYSSLPNTKESSVCLRDPRSNLNGVNTPCF